MKEFSGGCKRRNSVGMEELCSLKSVLCHLNLLLPFGGFANMYPSNVIFCTKLSLFFHMRPTMHHYVIEISLYANVK